MANTSIKSKPGPKRDMELWGKARALYESGKSFGQITAETGLNDGNLCRVAKTEGWEKGILKGLIDDTVRVKEEFTVLNLQQQATVTKEVDKQIKMLEFFNNSTLKNCSIMMKKVNADTDFYGHNSVQNTLHKGKETCFGKMPDVQVNNTNNNNNGALVMLDIGDME